MESMGVSFRASPTPSRSRQLVLQACRSHGWRFSPGVMSTHRLRARHGTPDLHRGSRDHDFQTPAVPSETFAIHREIGHGTVSLIFFFAFPPSKHDVCAV
mmetsp:Transcript_112787/g.258279  ORF Transcript_112787/g.258279 Transcript_112787/m.258279 type:complete len:100 (+) Transcript_112787:526-825(+)